MVSSTLFLPSKSGNDSLCVVVPMEAVKQYFHVSLFIIALINDLIIIFRTLDVLERKDVLVSVLTTSKPCRAIFHYLIRKALAKVRSRDWVNV